MIIFAAKEKECLAVRQNPSLRLVNLADSRLFAPSQTPPFPIGVWSACLRLPQGCKRGVHAESGTGRSLRDHIGSSRGDAGAGAAAGAGESNPKTDPRGDPVGV